MKDLNIKRSIGFSLLFYCASFILFPLVALIFGTSLDTKPQDIPALQCVVYLVLMVAPILFLAKWYFRKFQPSTKRGLLLGVTAIIISCVLDIVLIALSMPGRIDVNMLLSAYLDWKFFASVVIVVGTTTYTGFEFDRTYTFDETAGLKKK